MLGESTAQWQQTLVSLQRVEQEAESSQNLANAIESMKRTRIEATGNRLPLRATEAWTDGRHSEDDKNVELDYKLAVALATATEGAARSTVLKVAQAEPSYGFVAWQALTDGHASK